MADAAAPNSYASKKRLSRLARAPAGSDPGRTDPAKRELAPRHRAIVPESRVTKDTAGRLGPGRRIAGARAGGAAAAYFAGAPRLAPTRAMFVGPAWFVGQQIMSAIWTWAGRVAA